MISKKNQNKLRDLLKILLHDNRDISDKVKGQDFFTNLKEFYRLVDSLGYKKHEKIK